MLENSMARLPSYDRSRHFLPRCHVTVPRNQQPTESGACHAVITIGSRNFLEAVTIRELARQTPVDVPTHIDPRGRRYASTWWMQPRGDEAVHAWQAVVSV